VNLDTIADFFQAGACAVGLGGNLVEAKAVAAGDMARIKSLAEQYVAAVKQARGALKK
jgi:2-dehydro-3-deoxyphosphogluconate aldolase/(4S)-4-hydroxy-2-oxoglutarate aldolase